VNRSLLLVTQYYPPSEMMAARRSAGFARYLEDLGVSVTVVTSGTGGTGPRARVGAGDVIGTRDLMSSRLNWRRRNLRALAGEAQASGPAYTADASRLARVIVPDVTALTWLPHMLPSVARLARRRHFDCVLTTSGPESAHAAGLWLRRRGIGWIADLRDGWTFESIHDFPPPLDRLDASIERAVMTRADVVTAVSEPIAKDLRTRYGADVHTLTNGYDPEELPPARDGDPLLAPDRFSLVHTGRIAAGQRTPAPLLDAIRLLRDRSPEIAGRIEVVLAGPLTADELALVGAPDLRGVVHHAGSLPRRRALELQRAASGLLLLTSGARRGEATGKLFEYLAAERPILVLGEDSEAARIVRATASGSVSPAGDVPAIATALQELVTGGPKSDGHPAVSRTAYSYPRLTARLAELVELAVERAERRKTRR
jgi:glycosyltransferase involved in cell wall biosynthesis